MAFNASCRRRSPHPFRSSGPIFHLRSQKRCAQGLFSPLVPNKIRTGICEAKALWSKPPVASDSSSGWGATIYNLSDFENGNN